MDKETVKTVAETDMPAYLKYVYEREGLRLFLVILSYISTLVAMVAFGYVLVVEALADILVALELVVVTLVPFVGVSVLRHLFDAPRPSQLFDMSPLGDKAPKKEGKSFPSRHVFSAFVIGTALSFAEPVLGALVLFFGTSLGACRVLLGHHFLRDVVAGGLIGAVCGVIGMLIVNIT